MAQRKRIEAIGSFDGVVEKHDTMGWFAESGEKKTPYILVPVVISEGDHKGEVGYYQGWLSDNAFDNTIARLAEVFGFNGDLPALYDGKVSLQGLPCNITVELEEFKGKKKYKVAWLNPVGGGAARGKPLEENKVKALLKKLGSRGKTVAKAQLELIAKGGGAVPKDPQKAAEAAQPDPNEDNSDIPF
jgi:hypothetical protein